GKPIDIFTHADADGISASSLFAMYLYLHDLPFRIKFTRPYGSKEMVELGKSEEKRFFVFLDQGSREIPTLERAVTSRGHEVLILDHHPGQPPQDSRLICLNPHLMGLNGAKEACASSVVYSVVEKMERRLRKGVWLALVGALGDRQELQEGFTGINALLLRRALEEGVVERKEGMKLLDREDVPTPECLRISIRPYLPGISGNSRVSVEIPEKLGLPLSSTLEELGEEGERRLCEALVERLGEEMRGLLWGAVYYLKDRSLPNLRKWAVALDASDTYKRPEIGFAANLGDEEAKKECLLLLQGYQRRMLENMNWFSRNLPNFSISPKARYVKVGREIPSSEMGEMLSLALESRLVEGDRPLIGLAETDEGEVKVSGRATFHLTSLGINIGRVMNEAAKAVGGVGGGHDVSGAAYIPKDRVEDFIREVERCLPQPIQTGRKEP
ncbi:MAG: DHH family phosphoesterase, partial [Candidatus Hadarchaeales archaeon]